MATSLSYLYKNWLLKEEDMLPENIKSFIFKINQMMKSIIDLANENFDLVYKWDDNASDELYPAFGDGVQDVIIGSNASASADIWLKKEGGAIFNQQQNDSDWQYSSVGNTHLLFGDASTNRIGINQSTPTAKLHITGDGDEEQLLVDGLDYQDDPIVKITGVQDLLGLGDVNMLTMVNKYGAIGVNVDPKDALPSNPGTTLMHLKGYQYGTSGVGQGGAHMILEGQQGIDSGGDPSWGSARFDIHTETKRGVPNIMFGDNAYGGLGIPVGRIALERDGGGAFPKNITSIDRNDFEIMNYKSGNKIIFATNPSGGLEAQVVIDSDGRVGINKVSPTAMLDLVGDQDQVQQRIKLNSTQTSNAWELQNSSGTNLSWFNGSGNADINQLTINNSFTLPTSDGAANQMLETDGAGNVTWVTPSFTSYDTLIMSDGDLIKNNAGELLVA